MNIAVAVQATLIWSLAKPKTWLWCRACHANNTLKPIGGDQRRVEGENASPSFSYSLTLRASLYLGKCVGVSKYSFFIFFFSSSGCRFIEIVHSLSTKLHKACVTCCGAGKGKSFCVQSTQEEAKWALQMWQCGTFQAQTDKRGNSTRMNKQIHEHSVVHHKE